MRGIAKFRVSRTDSNQHFHTQVPVILEKARKAYVTTKNKTLNTSILSLFILTEYHFNYLHIYYLGTTYYFYLLTFGLPMLILNWLKKCASCGSSWKPLRLLSQIWQLGQDAWILRIFGAKNSDRYLHQKSRFVCWSLVHCVSRRVSRLTTHYLGRYLLNST